MALNLNPSTTLLNGHLSSTQLHHPRLSNAFDGMCATPSNGCLSAIVSNDCGSNEVISPPTSNHHRNNDNNNNGAGVKRCGVSKTDVVRDGGGNRRLSSHRDYHHHRLHVHPLAPEASICSATAGALSPLALSPLTLLNNGLLTYRGVVQSSKAPPPLTYLPSSINQQKPGIRSSVAVPPLNQVSPNSALNAANVAAAANHGGNARTSSFAAALRKLAEQVTEPIPEKELSPVSPASSPCSTPASKRGSSTLVLNNSSNTNSHHSSSNSYPPTTISVGQTQGSLTYIDGRKNLERVVVVQPRDGGKGTYEDSSRKAGHTNSRMYSESSKEESVSDTPVIRGTTSGSHLDRRDVDVSPSKGTVSSFLPIHHSAERLQALKIQGPSSSSVYYGDRGREEQSHQFTVNGLTPSQEMQHIRSQHHSSSMPTLSARLEEAHLSSSSSFQPYRSASDELRHGLPPHLSSTYDSAPPYGYHPAAFLPPHLQHPSFRLDDPLYLERYGVLRSPLFPLPHPGVLPPPSAMSFVPGSRYAPELLTHSLSLVSPTGHHLLAQERYKLEEQHQRRERELELYQEQQERRRERDREKEREREAATELVLLQEREKELKSPWSHTSRRSESPGRAGGVGSIMQGTPRDLVNRSSSTMSSSTVHPVSSSSSPPNLTSSLSDAYTTKPSSSISHPAWSASFFSRPSMEPYGDQNEYKTGSRDVHVYTTPSHPVLKSLLPDAEKPHEAATVSVKVETSGRDLVDGSAARRSSLSLLGTSKVQQTTCVPSAASRRYSVATPDAAGLGKVAKHPPDLIPNRTVASECVAAPNRGSRRFTVVESSSSDSDRRLGNHVSDSFVRVVPPPISSEASPSKMADFGPSINSSRPDRQLLTHPRPLVVPHFASPFLPQPLPAVCSTTVLAATGTMATMTAASLSTSTSVVTSGGPVVMSQVSVLPFPRMSSPQQDGGSQVEPKSDVEVFGNASKMVQICDDGVKSKLDLVIERARLKNRSIDDDGSDVDEEDAVEETRLSRLVTIFSGPPLPLDTSKKKMSFLSALGLTTQRKKREIELDSFVRRHRILNDVVPSQSELNCSCETTSSLWFLSHDITSLKYSPDELCSEPSYQQKVQFLQQLDMSPITRSKREENEEILRAVIEEKIKRNGFTFPNLQRFKHSLERDENQPPSLSNLACGSKRKATDTPVLTSDQPKNTRITSLLSSSKRKRTSSPPQKRSEPQGTASVQVSPTKNVVLNQTNKVTVTSAAAVSQQEINSRVWQVCGRDFAHEFHESVLLQTQQQKLKSRKVESPQVSDSNDGSVQPKRHHNDQVIHSSGFLSGFGAVERGNGHLKWPGIEVLMEAYERHQQEQKFEKEVLMEQCSRLKIRNQELNNLAESLSQSMSDLIHIKKDLDEERECHQKAIDNLKCFLKKMR